MTWIYDKFHEIPYLRVMADYGSGKTRFLRVAGELCNKPIFASGGTTLSPIFRMVDDIRGTLIFDEADFERSDKTSDLVKILNAGYSKGGVVMRSEGKGTFEVKYFNVFGPKILANREPFADQALESRFLVIKMRRTKREDLPSQLTKSFYKEADEIRNKLLYWRLKNYPIPIDFDRYQIKNVQPRLKQIALPILATMKNEKTSTEFRKFIQNYNQELLDNRSDGFEADIIKAILYLKTEDNNYPTAKEINEKMVSLDGWDNEMITDRKLGAILKNKLHLKTERKTKGFTLNLIKYDDEIKSLAERYGVDEEEVLKNMNDMNVMNEKPEDINPFKN
jgi:hypothetical protein